MDKDELIDLINDFTVGNDRILTKKENNILNELVGWSLRNKRIV